MAAVGGGANHKMTGSEVILNSDSNTSTFQAEDLLNLTAGTLPKLFS